MSDPAAGAATGMQITGAAQHAAWRERALPPVEQLREDLWSLPVPIPHGGLRYVSCYVLGLPGGGLALVDSGWGDDAAWTALTGGLASIGADVADVRGVLVTHLHFDHLGLAERIRQASGAWVAMHPADAEIVGSERLRNPRVSVEAEVAFLVSLGAEPDEAAADVGPPSGYENFSQLAQPDRLLEHGDLADVPGWALRAVHTPGHTPGHLCFAEERTGLFFSGDHVLPRISPNISTTADGLPDPLSAYLRSLESCRDGLDGEPTEVLPAHEWRFRGLAARTAELAAHHEHRLEELRTAVAEHPGSTPWDLAAYLTWSRSWDQYERRMRIFAVTETDAHLRLLAARGEVVGDGAPVPRWSVRAR